MTGEESPGSAPSRRGRFGRGGRWYEFRLGARIGLVVTVILILAGIFASLIAPANPLHLFPQTAQGPSLHHLLGTDLDGRDVLSRLIYGSTSAYEGVGIAMLVTAIIGIPWGLIAGFGGKAADEGLMRLADVFFSFPALILSIGIISVLGPTLVHSMVAVGIAFAPSIARLLRGATLPLRRADFVLVASSLGVRRRRSSRSSRPGTAGARRLLDHGRVPAPEITLELLDGMQAAQHADEMQALAAEVYADPPYRQDAEQAGEFAGRFRVQRRQPGFALAQARHGQYLVGYALGLPLRPSASWWRNLTAPLPAEMTTEHPGRTFALAELLVRAPWRRQGIGRDLHDLILAGRPEERATLTVRPDAAPAQGAFQAWGWRKVARAREPQPGSPVLDVLVRALPGGRP